jgi:hypothetical protein
VAARGRIDKRHLRGSDDVRPGSERDLDLAVDLTRRRRGAAHGRDLAHLLAEGCRMLVIEDRGYVVSRGAQPMQLAAESADTAAALLRTCLFDAGPQDTVDISWITGNQQWAIEVALQAGLAIHPQGPLMTRAMEGAPECYLPNGMFG